VLQIIGAVRMCRYLEHYKILLAKKRYGGAPTGGVPAAPAVPVAPALTSSLAHRSTAAAIPPQEDGDEPTVAPLAKRARRETAAAAKKKRTVLLPEHSASPVAAHTRRSAPPPATAASLSKISAPATSVGQVANGPPAAGASSGVKRAKTPQASLPKQKSPPPWAGMTAAALAQEQQRQQWLHAALLPGDFAAPLVPAVALPPTDALITSIFNLGATIQQPLLAQPVSTDVKQDDAQLVGAPEPLPLSNTAGSQYSVGGKQAEQQALPCLSMQQQQQSLCQPPAEHANVASEQIPALAQPESAFAAMHFLSGDPNAPPRPARQQQPAQTSMADGATAQTSAAQPQTSGVQAPAVQPTAGRLAPGISTSHGPPADGVSERDAEHPSAPGAGSDTAQGLAAEEQPTAPARPADSSGVRLPGQPSAGHAGVKATYANGHAMTDYALERPRRDVRAPNRMPVGPVDAHQVLAGAVALVMLACAASSPTALWVASLMTAGGPLMQCHEAASRAAVQAALSGAPLSFAYSSPCNVTTQTHDIWLET